MKTKKVLVESETEISNDLVYCEASYDSNGCICIRKMPYNGNTIELLCLSYQETKAIIELFEYIKNRESEKPF